MKDKTVLLQKLKALANKGIGGEKQNAERMLNSLMAKYNISEAELSEDKIIEANFTYHGEAQKTILAQIIYMVTNKKDNVYEYINTRTGRKRRTVIGADVTAAQKIEIEFLFDFYIKQYEKEQDAFLKAFEVWNKRDSKEPKVGTWLGTVCTVCGESTSFYYDCDYCPQCGAKMEAGA